MADQLSTGGDMPPPGANPGSSSSNFYIVGYNMLALAIYTFMCKFSSDGGGYIFDAIFLVMHFIVCIILAFVAKGSKIWMWVLSAVLVLAIGVSTCVAIPPFVK